MCFCVFICKADRKPNEDKRKSVKKMSRKEFDILLKERKISAEKVMTKHRNKYRSWCYKYINVFYNKDDVIQIGYFQCTICVNFIIETNLNTSGHTLDRHMKKYHYSIWAENTPKKDSIDKKKLKEAD